MVELVETAVRLKQPQTAFPGTLPAREPLTDCASEVQRLTPWIEETLSAWGRV
jgi:hypothetical protein